ncbi:alanine racemase [Oceanicoccus sagamiensis]|uniref:Alanine racemase n=1 Tax=Oceanicoccus sagamiensis TaxID=716816 RepID=A0A1X9ND11_9GAMM|nr:alanine racemase [Oceanicoccus sagamiensis]ARN72847.1 alanine racemase [Oceanicoccus sagamiensis]
MARPTTAFIDLAALKHNFQFAQRLVPEGQCVAVVKANAYGHGAVPVAKALEPLAPALGVACIEEADELRQAGIHKPILLLEGVFTADEIEQASANNYWIMLENQQQLHSLLNAELTQPIKVWLKLDTGMHRLGINPEQVTEFYQQLQASPNVDNDIILATHLACGDDLGSDFTDTQIACFMAAVKDIDAPLSIGNSSGVLAWPKARTAWNRPGYMLYGNSPFNIPQENADQLQQVMTLKSAVISVREVAAGESVGYAANWTAERPSTIATIAVGYGDGYPRSAPNGTPVIVNGQRVKLVGNVSMDMITVDVTDLDSVAIGDEVILWGPELTANEIAQWAGTIGYEILTRMPLRAPRIYK